MPQPVLNARINRIIALRNIAAKNAQSDYEFEVATNDPAAKASNNPWQIEQIAA